MLHSHRSLSSGQHKYLGCDQRLALSIYLLKYLFNL